MYRLCEVFNLRVHIFYNIPIKLAMVTATIASASLIIAVGPIMDRYEDLFVNGMTSNPKIKFFYRMNINRPTWISSKVNMETYQLLN